MLLCFEALGSIAFGSRVDLLRCRLRHRRHRQPAACDPVSHKNLGLGSLFTGQQCVTRTGQLPAAGAVPQLNNPKSTDGPMGLLSYLSHRQDAEDAYKMKLQNL